MKLSECNPGDLVWVMWRDPTDHQTTKDGTPQLVLFGSAGKKNTLPIVELCNPETQEPYRNYHNLHALPADVDVIEVVVRNKRGKVDRDIERSQERRGDAEDPLMKNHERAASFALQSDLDDAGFTKGQKAEYVKSQGQTRDHVCHWPGCGKQVPPAQWGCKTHWMMLPKVLRDRIWNAYRPGQERDMRPSSAYLEAAEDVQTWIKGFLRRAKENSRR